MKILGVCHTLSYSSSDLLGVGSVSLFLTPQVDKVVRLLIFLTGLLFV